MQGMRHPMPHEALRVHEVVNDPFDCNGGMRAARYVGFVMALSIFGARDSNRVDIYCAEAGAD